MNNTPYFSIIVPMYNAEKYIKICVDSILMQTFQDFEVIIVDDCSTDNSYKICTELYGNNKKVRLLRHEKNLGLPSFGRNYGLEKSVGEYVWFVDNDDAILPNALEKLHKAIQAETGGVDAVHLLGLYTTPQNDNKPIDLSKLTFHCENRNEGFVDEDIIHRLQKNWLSNRIDASTWLGIYKREFFTKHKIKFPHCRADDVPIAFAGICFAKRYLMLRDAFYIWRIRDQSLSHSKTVTQLCNSLTSLPILFNSVTELMSKIPEIVDNRILKEQCIIQIWEILFRDHVRPLYDGVNIPIELDNEVYEAMLPIFGENTTLVKYLFHGFNNMWRQANILAMQRNFFAQQVQSLQQREKVIQKQTQLIEQMKKLLEQYDRII